ncbi:hypothetical protein [Streptomyces sp. CAU 1734]|uniref:hypothetical protein n=1 Tax=Streptomyces sp. CAU 1734 TaxID=3140360 RepID=UPI0032607D1B
MSETAMAAAGCTGTDPAARAAGPAHRTAPHRRAGADGGTAQAPAPGKNEEVQA